MSKLLSALAAAWFSGAVLWAAALPAAQAAEYGPGPGYPPAGPALPFAGLFSETELREFMGFLSAALIARLAGLPPPVLPPDLAFKYEIAKKQLLKAEDPALRTFVELVERELGIAPAFEEEDAPGDSDTPTAPSLPAAPDEPKTPTPPGGRSPERV